MADSPQTILQKLVETALTLCRADSAGISILEPKGAAGVFRWYAIAGQFASNIGVEMPRDASPSGTVLDRDVSLLFSYPERHFDYGMTIAPPIVEALLVPFHTEGKPVGTLWLISHTPFRKFEREDQRVLSSLSHFASTAYQVKMAALTAVRAKEDVRQILNTAAIGLTRCSRDLRYLACNRAYETLVGLSAEQIIGRPINDVIGTNAFQVKRPYIERVLRGERVEYEEEVPFAASGNRFLHVVYEPWFDCEGQVSGWIASVSDITDLKRTTKALRDSEEREAFLLRLSDTIRPLSDPLAIQKVTARLVGEHLHVNRVGYADIEGTDFITRLDYADGVAPFQGRGPVAIFGESLLEAYRRGEPVAVNDVCSDPRLTESERAVLLANDIAAFAGEMLLKNKQWVAVFGVQNATPRAWTKPEVELMRDVAERVWEAVERARAEAALREREQRLRQALDASGAGSWMRDARTGHIDWDGRFRKLYGFTAEEPASLEAWLSRIHEEDRQQVVELVKQIRHTKTHDTFDSTFRIVRPDGTVSWIQSVGQAHRDADGQLTWLTGLELDVTERRHAEEALQARRAEVRDRVLQKQAEEALRRSHSELEQRTLQLSRLASQLTLAETCAGNLPARFMTASSSYCSVPG
jgi:PAS domain S-box-containing protein